MYDRDNLTLMEHCYDDPANAWTKKGLGPGPGPGPHGLGPGFDPGSGGYDMDQSGLAEDDTMMVLDRLRDLTTRTLHLQARLRREHLAKQAAVSVSDQMYVSGGVDFGAGAGLTLSDVPAVRALQQATTTTLPYVS